MTITDTPIAHTADGRPLYDNTPTVVATLAFVSGNPIIIRRNTQPGFGLLALPGGYHMRGETWQQAGCREIFEETGWRFDPAGMKQIGETITDEYGNNLIIAKNHDCLGHIGEMNTAEVQQIQFLTHPGEREEWAFPLHYQAALRDYLG